MPEDKEKSENLEMNVDSEEKKKKKNILFLLIKRHKVKMLLLLFFALAANTYAWFIYNKIVSSDISAEIKAWNVSFDGANDGVLEFNLDDMYPGMNSHEETVSLTNNGDLNARVSFTLHSIEILGEAYSIEGPEGYTVADLTKILKDNYPFEVTFTSSADEVDGNGGRVDLSFKVVWPYESGNDALDTKYGQLAYEFENNPDNKDKKCLKITLDVNIVQVEG